MATQVRIIMVKTNSLLIKLCISFISALVQLSGFAHDLTLSGGGLGSDYVVEQIHMHWWSEHTINDIRYPLEVHIVHRNTIYPNISMAANFKEPA